MPNTSATAASSGSDLNGMAARDACRQLRSRLANSSRASGRLTSQSLRFGGDGVTADSGDGQTRQIAFADLAHDAWFTRVSLSAQGFYRTPKIHWNVKTFKGQPFYYFAYGAACAQVAIDTLTGR